jgi:hypothetical protein
MEKIYRFHEPWQFIISGSTRCTQPLGPDQSETNSFFLNLVLYAQNFVFSIGKRPDSSST